MTQAAGVANLWRLADDVSAIVNVAARRVMAIYATEFEVHRKQDQSPVTSADLAAHDIISDGLCTLDPGLPILSEEGDIPPFEERRSQRLEKVGRCEPIQGVGTRAFLHLAGDVVVGPARSREGHRPDHPCRTDSRQLLDAILQAA